MNLASSYHTLKLNPGATMEEVKKAYRAMALSLHPDHNQSPQAHRQFQRVHEAYLTIKAHLETKPPSKASGASQAYARQAAQAAQARPGGYRPWAPQREEGPPTSFSWRKKHQNETEPQAPPKPSSNNTTTASGKTTDRAWRTKTDSARAQGSSAQDKAKSTASAEARKKEPPTQRDNPIFDWTGVSRDTWNPSRAKRPGVKESVGNPETQKIFDGIYSQLKREPGKPALQGRPGDNGTGPRQAIKLTTEPVKDMPSTGQKVWDSMKSWFRSKLDEEQVLYVPRDVLLPGAKLRLQIRQPWSGEMMGIEVTLPSDYIPGKPIRLKKLGRRLGNMRGDLYVRLVIQ